MKITAAGIAVIADDALLSQWVEREGRLDVSRERALVDAIKMFIPAGGVVCDIGASLGDHTVIYAALVGRAGHVYAFEPNPPAFACLAHNTGTLGNVTIWPCALGSVDGECGIAADPQQPKNYGMATLVAGTGVRMVTLDQMAADWHRLDYIKLDVEGCELDVLRGAEQTIARFRPAILMEVNDYALRNHGTHRSHIFALLASWGYVFAPVMRDDTQLPEERIDASEIDVICLPPEKCPADVTFLRWRPFATAPVVPVDPRTSSAYSVNHS